MPADNPATPDDIDRDIRINELKHAAEDAAGGDMTTWEADDAEPELMESFWESVVAYEKAPATSDFEQLAEAGVALPPPEELPDADLSAKLWEMISFLARRRVFIHNTDHLSDRVLYTKLWTESLREAKPDLPVSPHAMFGIDILGSGSDEDTLLYMRYYADDEYRASWMKSWPNYDMPPREKPPYDRDRLLPKSGW